jgi:LysR family hca operon transcriptional activator
MDLRYLRYFIAVAEERSFTRAAARMHTVQPSLSQQIKRLEDVFVGTPLFHRDKHHVELTEAGRVFLPEARAILAGVDRAIALARQAARAEIGQVTIGFVPGAEGKVFPHVLPVLRMRCPGIQLNLRSLSSPEQLTALLDRTIDVGFLRPPVDHPSLACELVLREPILAVVPSQHELAGLDHIPVERLAELPFIQVGRKGAPAIHDMATQIASLANVTFRPLLETDSVLGTLNAVGSGLGFSLLPDYVRLIGPTTVAARPLSLDPAPQIDLVVAYRRDDQLAGLAAFLDLLRIWIAGSKEASL